MHIDSYIESLCREAKEASIILRSVRAEQKNKALERIAQLIRERKDEIIRETLTTKDGQVQNERLRSLLNLEPLLQPATTPPLDHLAGE